MPAEFTSSESALEWLYSRQMLGAKLGLEQTRALLAALDLPGTGQRFFHVAGTNGKGSTCAFLHSLMSTAGFNTGLFTSPHLTRFQERIRDSREEISTEDLRQILGKVRRAVEGDAPQTTFFEAAFAAALEWFRMRALPWVVLETGMGGRLDATNIVSPAVTVITPIGMDHAEFLGDTLALIAGEKAGIIKRGIPVVTGPQEPEAMEVLQAKAKEKEAPLILVEQPWTGSRPGLAGAHQRWNAAMAVAAWRAAGFDASPGVVADALAATRWPGRFERLRPDLALDGAHNAHAARALAQTWREEYPDRQAAIVMGAVREKDVEAMLAELRPIAGSWHLPAFASPRARSPEEMESLLRASGITGPATLHATVEDAVAGAAATGAPVLVTGSLFLVGEARAVLAPEPDAAFEPSAQ
jgi:dihydrofolate synthase/folylpolyglutamate synthase